ncbi:MAG: hypothetical protein IKY18_01355 [Oscillospiraceae bacterium]|nr:hypothetical protein [Oscillospiraceae bacterium]
MFEPKRISPLLDGMIMGDPINEHHGIYCCPAIKEDTDEKYIVKIISVPAYPAQMDALLLSGAYPDEETALAYYKEVADEIIAEIDIQKRLSEQEGYTPYDAWQLEPKEDGKGYDIYLLRTYNRTLETHFKRHAFTHLDALNLGLDLCAAMSVSRRSGYLYVGLKPGNIFVTDQLQYKVGGLGFIKLDSLKYMSLPEKSRSIYTPAEISDAYAALNTTIDIYAIGLILYQAYNNGELPFNDDITPGAKLPSPLYADYEMSEIILKACDPDPAERWQEPVQMGQAIVEYMQRNGALDSPIVPLPTAEENVTEDDGTSQIEESPVETESAPVSAEINENQEAITIEEDKEDASLVADELTDVPSLSDVTAEDLHLTGDETNYEKLTGEVTEILTQADELATLSVPEPVTVPEYIELPELEPIEVEAEAPNTEETIDSEEEDVEEDSVEPTAEDEAEEIDEDESSEDRTKKRHWVRNSVIVLLIAGLLAAGYFIYKHFFVIVVDSISLNGAKDSLIVNIETSDDETLLQVVCVDTYGNRIPATVKDGKAEFKELPPSTAYNIKIVANSYYSVAGVGPLTYSTPIQSNIVHFDAITGATDGSVILNFTIDGPDSEAWTVNYSTEGEAERTAEMVSHRVTISDLTVGKAYKFRLVPKEDLYVTGESEILYTARKVIKAEKVNIVSCINNELVVKWATPAGEKVTSWQISCIGGTYNQTATVSDTTVTFKNLDHTSNFIVEVKAEGMSEGVKKDIPANSITVTDMKADNSKSGTLKFTWNTSQSVPKDGWKLHYAIVGIEQEKSVACDKNEATISSLLPNVTYRIWLTDAKDVPLLGSVLEAKTASGSDYSQKVGRHELKRSDLVFHMCKTSSLQNWNGKKISDVKFESTFATGEGGSYLIELKKDYITLSDNSVEITFLVRNAESTPVLLSTTTSTLAKMWKNDYCKLQMPPMPTAAGTYTIDVYFNGGLAATQQFKIA